MNRGDCQLVLPNFVEEGGMLSEKIPGSSDLYLVGIYAFSVKLSMNFQTVFRGELLISSGEVSGSYFQEARGITGSHPL